MNRGRKTSPPPYFWKVPAPEKDHMTENYRRIRNIAAEGLRKRGEPLKANFIPGVTKNSRYAHIPSKVGASLKGQALPQKSCSDELVNRRLQIAQKFDHNADMRGHQASQQGNFGQQRQSRSSHDLRTINSREPPFNHQGQRNSIRKEVSLSATNGQRPAAQSVSQPSVRILQPNPPDESIYKWRFNDDPPLLKDQYHRNGDNTNEPNTNSQQHCHRVEYLPCDGICAEETVMDDKNLDSARSSSSRTSRGCNTEETRIFAESGAKPNLPYRCRSLNLGENGSHSRSLGDNPDARNETERQLFQTKKKGFFTVNGASNTQDDALTHIRNRSSQNFDIITNGDFERNMKGLNIRDGQKNQKNKTSNGIITHKNSGAGDLPHNLGTVPKYLKQRQEEWRVEEAVKKEAEQNAHVPPGYMLMKEEERMENLKKFKTNYDMLIAELNRIPIRIDTIRVRDHKIQLEKQLTRLEEAMKTFSRPKVWVKVDD